MIRVKISSQRSTFFQVPLQFFQFQFSKIPGWLHLQTPKLELNIGKTVYVANLSKRVDERELRDKFRKYGRIDSYNIVFDPIVRESRGFGFVTFESRSDAQDAVRDLDGTEFEGRDLIVQIAKRSKPRKSTPGKYLGYDKYRGRRDRSGSR